MSAKEYPEGNIASKAAHDEPPSYDEKITTTHHEPDQSARRESVERRQSVAGNIVHNPLQVSRQQCSILSMWLKEWSNHMIGRD
jgi:hypothetical protein